MSGDDDLERRLRETLTAPRASDRLDADTFLQGVHRGARVRKVRRQVSVVLGSALLVAGGGVAISASGIFDATQTPAAGRDTGQTTPNRTFGTEGTGGAQSPTPRQTKLTVTPKDPGPLRASEVTPVSLTATGTAHQWVLAKVPGNDCGRAFCATLFATDSHGKPKEWSDLGQLPVTVSTVDDPTPGSVSSLRFTKRADDSGIYDGWAYGDALWSTHDSGQSWSQADSPAGQVTQLESWGDFVYAAVQVPSTTPGNGVTSGATTDELSGSPSTPPTTPGAGAPSTSTDDQPGDTILYRSPATADDWQPVSVGQPLSNVVALTAAQDLVAFIDVHGLDSTLYVSQDGVTWEPQTACPDGTTPAALSAAGDTDLQVSSLWVTCSSLTDSVVEVMRTDAWGQWTQVQGQFGPGVLVAARTIDFAMAAGGGIRGIVQVSADQAPQSVYDKKVGAPLFFGFTNANYGYLLNSNGKILSTTNGDDPVITWKKYAVGNTAPTP